MPKQSPNACLFLDVTCVKGKLEVAGKLINFGKRDTKDQKVLRAFLAQLCEVVQEFDKDTSLAVKPKE